MKIKIETLNRPNRNNSIYTTEVMQRAINTDIVKERLRNKALFVYMRDEGDDYSKEPPPSNIVASVSNLYIEDDQFLCADIELLDTPAGRALKKGFETSFSVSFSCTGNTTVKNDYVFVKECILTKNLYAYPDDTICDRKE